MKIYLIRHGIRETPDDFSEAEEGDPEAGLTEEGEALATSVGEWMAKNDAVPTLILASPTARTQQTAELIADAIRDGGYAPPPVKVESSVGPFSSIRGLLLKLGKDEEKKRVAIVTHKGTIVNGLKALNVDNEAGEKVDPPAMGELRMLRVDRETGAWTVKYRVRPSDLGHPDLY